jgi:hypothetical protein
VTRGSAYMAGRWRGGVKRGRTPGQVVIVPGMYMTRRVCRHFAGSRGVPTWDRFRVVLSVGQAIVSEPVTNRDQEHSMAVRGNPLQQSSPSASSSLRYFVPRIHHPTRRHHQNPRTRPAPFSSWHYRSEEACLDHPEELEANPCSPTIRIV